ncbi:MAG: hypothetical protein ACRDPQ_01775 [Nocardioidaceae bacterium]
MLGSVITAVYRAETDGAIREGSAEPVATAARDNLAATVSAARELPDPLTDDVVGMAQAAFTTGFQTAAAISAVLMGGLAFAVGRRRGRAAPPS